MSGTSHKGYPIGISLGQGTPLPLLIERLAQCAQLGLQGIELGAMTGNVIIDGSLRKNILREIRAILKDHPFRYTVHCTDGLDLRNKRHAELHRKVFLAGLELTAEIGGELYVSHFSAKSPDPVLESMFEKTTLELANAAAGMKVAIGVENIEIEPIESVLDFLERTPHPALGMTLDFGHAWLSNRLYGGDIDAQLARARPLIRHMHIHDNAGRFDPNRLENRQRSLKERLPLGFGDLHLAAGWGNIPFPRLLPVVRDGYRGLYMMEQSVGIDADSVREARDLIESCLGTADP